MRRGVVIALAAVALLLLPAASASASHHEFRIGVGDGELNPEPNIAGMATADVRVFRTLFSWPRIEDQRPPGAGCVGGRYDWAYTDRVVREAGRRGVDVLPYIAGSPPYVAGGESKAPLTTSPAMDDYECFVSAVVRRYGRGGTFPAFDPLARPITQWQVWNEPNLPHFAPIGGPSPREYGRFLTASRTRIMQLDPSATIVLAGLPEFSRQGMDAKPFLQRFYRIPGIERRFDALSLHPYGRSSLGVKGAMLRLEDLLGRVGDPQRSVWLTEFGWASHPRVRHFIVKSERGQANQLEKTIKMLRRNRTRFNIGTLAWFRWRDTAPRSANRGPFDYAGLHLENGKPKPSCRVFTRFTGGRCGRIPGPRGASGASAAMQVGAQAVTPSPEE